MVPPVQPSRTKGCCRWPAIKFSAMGFGKAGGNNAFSRRRTHRGTCGSNNGRACESGEVSLSTLPPATLLLPRKLDSPVVALVVGRQEGDLVGHRNITQTWHKHSPVHFSSRFWFLIPSWQNNSSVSFFFSPNFSVGCRDRELDIIWILVVRHLSTGQCHLRL